MGTDAGCGALASTVGAMERTTTTTAIARRWHTGLPGNRRMVQFQKDLYWITSAVTRNVLDLRIFAKPNTLKNRRMGVALARAGTAEDAVERAKAAAARVHIRYTD